MDDMPFIPVIVTFVHLRIFTVRFSGEIAESFSGAATVESARGTELLIRMGYSRESNAHNEATCKNGFI